MGTEDFKKENQEIHELQMILMNLVENNNLVTNPVFFELLGRYHDKIAAHLLHEDSSIYAGLLKHKDKKVNEFACSFLANTRELKKILSKYSKGYRKLSGNDAKYDKFLQESRDIFRLLDERIDLENKKLFPLIDK